MCKHVKFSSLREKKKKRNSKQNNIMLNRLSSYYIIIIPKLNYKIQIKQNEFESVSVTIKTINYIYTYIHDRTSLYH